MILSVSSSNVGINLRSDGHHHGKLMSGKPMRLKDIAKYSIPSVSSIGDVVSVSNEVPMINRIKRTAINTARSMPFKYTFINPNLKSGSPSPVVRKTFIKKANTMSITRV